MYDLIIIGGGPAGMSAAIYAKRAMLNVLVVEKEYLCGGQIVNAEKVDNYLGMNNTPGMEMATTFRKHMEKLEVPARQGAVASLKTEGETKTVVFEDGSSLETKAILIATGSNHKALGIPGEKKLVGAGVSYCATCDGAFFRGRNVAVIGGGNVAIADAIYLSRLAKHVTLIHRREGYRADKILIETLKKTENITEKLCYELDEIVGGGTVKEIHVHNNQTNEKETLAVEGVFIAVGMLPQTYFVGDEIKVENGYIVAGEDCKTNVPGIFVAGDVRTKQVRQLVTAVADGAVAISSIEEYLTNMS